MTDLPQPMLATQDENPLHLAISAVVPVYNEEETVGNLIVELKKALCQVSQHYEILLVDDGSTDRTAELINAATEADPHIRGIFLARNYGQSTAIQAGFDASRGELVVTLDGDLQNDPCDIPRMVEYLHKTDADLVSGWRRKRQDDFLRVRISNAANHIISRFTGLKLRDYGCSLKVYRREILCQIRIYGELHRFLPAVLHEVGAKVVEMEVTHHPRRFGQSKYGLDRIVRVTLDLLLIRFMHRYMNRPLHFFGTVGIAMLGFGGSIFFYLGFVKFVLGNAIADRPLLTVASVLTMGGIFLIGQGLIGEILVRILHEPAGRSQYVVRHLPRSMRARRSEVVTSPAEPAISDGISRPHG